MTSQGDCMRPCPRVCACARPGRFKLGKLASRHTCRQQVRAMEPSARQRAIGCSAQQQMYPYPLLAHGARVAGCSAPVRVPDCTLTETIAGLAARPTVNYAYQQHVRRDVSQACILRQACAWRNGAPCRRYEPGTMRCSPHQAIPIHKPHVRHNHLRSSVSVFSLGQCSSSRSAGTVTTTDRVLPCRPERTLHGVQVTATLIACWHACFRGPCWRRTPSPLSASPRPWASLIMTARSRTPCRHSAASARSPCRAHCAKRTWRVMPGRRVPWMFMHQALLRPQAPRHRAGATQRRHKRRKARSSLRHAERATEASAAFSRVY